MSRQWKVGDRVVLKSHHEIRRIGSSISINTKMHEYFGDKTSVVIRHIDVDRYDGGTLFQITTDMNPDDQRANNGQGWWFCPDWIDHLFVEPVTIQVNDELFTI